MYDLEEIVKAARMCHEVNRAYCKAIGDDSQPSWENAPDWQRSSALDGVKAHIDSGFTMTGEQSHESWMEAKRADGWRRGPHKDPVLKEHPAFCPYAELPDNIKVKDHLFRAVVHAHFGVNEA